MDIPFGIRSLKKIPSLILIAAFICTQNPESSDKSMFKGGQVRSHRRRKRKDYRIQNKSSVKLIRVISIFQSIVSLILDNSYVELRMFDQSGEFYQ